VRRASAGFHARAVSDDSPLFKRLLEHVESAAGQLRLRLLVQRARNCTELTGAMEGTARAGLRAIIVGVDPFVSAERKRIAELAIRYRIASVFPQQENVEAGGLIIAGLRRRSA
jgi:hypothetical protein